jgi:hypothetical protein
MRTRWLVTVVAIVAVAVTALVLRTAADKVASPSPVSPAADREEVGSPAALPPRSLTAGAVDIVIEPIRIDQTAAVFRVEMNTHSEELPADLARTSVLEVDGVEWSGVTWSGDPPGGHHRGGELTFEASGPATGSIVLSIDSFSAPVQANWTLSG